MTTPTDKETLAHAVLDLRRPLWKGVRRRRLLALARVIADRQIDECLTFEKDPFSEESVDWTADMLDEIIVALRASA